MVPLMLCFLQAIRQAQELGLHRETASDDPADHVEARRNVWGGLIVADRWISAFCQ